jgi:RNA polymerase sporulation-specific sigma factor
MYETNIKKLTDEELVSLAQKRDTQAMDELLLRYSQLVRFCARKFFLIGGETDDLIQEGMMGLFSAILDYKGKDEGGMRFKNFAYLCIWRKIIDAVKVAASKKNEPLNSGISADGLEIVSYAPDPEQIIIFDDDKRELKKVMSQVLSDYEFKVFNMYMDGMTCAEICEIIHKSGKSVDNAVQRSRKKLQEAFKK